MQRVQNLIRFLPSVTGRIIEFLGPHFSLVERAVITSVRVTALAVIAGVPMLNRRIRSGLRDRVTARGSSQNERKSNECRHHRAGHGSPLGQAGSMEVTLPRSLFARCRLSTPQAVAGARMRTAKANRRARP